MFTCECDLTPIAEQPILVTQKKNAAGTLRSNSDSSLLRALLWQTFTLPVGYVSCNGQYRVACIGQYRVLIQSQQRVILEQYRVVTYGQHRVTRDVQYRVYFHRQRRVGGKRQHRVYNS